MTLDVLLNTDVGGGVFSRTLTPPHFGTPRPRRIRTTHSTAPFLHISSPSHDLTYLSQLSFTIVLAYYIFLQGCVFFALVSVSEPRACPDSLRSRFFS